LTALAAPFKAKMEPKASVTDIRGSQSERRALVEVIVASTVGMTIELYDFFLYGTAAALIFPRLFFPEQGEFLGQVLSFLTFAAGFLARPVGAVLWGHLGDRVGRKSTLVTTLLVMGVSTMLIGALPTYQQVGAIAPVLLVLLRLVQGVGVGGEWGGAVLLPLETGHRGRRGFYASWPQAGVPLGLLASTGAFALFRRVVPEPAFSSWGWRLPFLLSALLVVLGLVIRLRIPETPLFRELKRRGQLAPSPVTETLRRHWREVLLAAGARLGDNSCFYLFTAFVLSYGKVQLRVDEDVLLIAVNLAAAVACCTIPLAGLLSDLWSRRAVYSCGCVWLAVFALPYYSLLGTREPTWIVAATVIMLAGGHAMLTGVQSSLIPELFGTRLRYTGASLGFHLAAPVAGGLSPTIAVWLVKAYPDETWPLAGYVMLTSLASLICVRLLAETSRMNLVDHARQQSESGEAAD
jgi:metabolite-proton symporter